MGRFTGGNTFSNNTSNTLGAHGSTSMSTTANNFTNLGSTIPGIGNTSNSYRPSSTGLGINIPSYGVNTNTPSYGANTNTSFNQVTTTFGTGGNSGVRPLSNGLGGLASSNLTTGMGVGGDILGNSKLGLGAPLPFTKTVSTHSYTDIGNSNLKLNPTGG